MIAESGLNGVTGPADRTTSRSTANPVEPDDVGAIVLSFDVEEHYRIEAAAKLHLAPALKHVYDARLEPSTRYLLDKLGEHGIKATFFVVGEIAISHPNLVRDIHRSGHEVASHGWDHQRVHRFTPQSFLMDLQRSRDALEQVTGSAVVGYRAPTFSIVRQTSWAIDVLSEAGFLYDSSIYPVRHDRYGIHQAPRADSCAGKGELNPRDSAGNASYAGRQLARRRRGLFPTAAAVGDGKGLTPIDTRLQSPCGDDLLSPMGIRSGPAAVAVAPPEPIPHLCGFEEDEKPIGPTSSRPHVQPRNGSDFKAQR